MKWRLAELLCSVKTNRLTDRRASALKRFLFNVNSLLSSRTWVKGLHWEVILYHCVKSHNEVGLLKCNQPPTIPVESQPIRNFNWMTTLTKRYVNAENILFFISRLIRVFDFITLIRRRLFKLFLNHAQIWRVSKMCLCAARDVQKQQERMFKNINKEVLTGLWWRDFKSDDHH